jgi:hypothetical protein
VLEQLGGVGLALEDAARWLRANLWLSVGLAILLVAVAVGGTLGVRWYHRRLRPLRPGAGADERIIHAYRQSLRWLAGAGLERPPAAAPWEFHELVATRRPRLTDDLRTLTGAYTEARFSSHAPEGQAVSEAEAALARLREAIFNDESEEAGQGGSST